MNGCHGTGVGGVSYAGALGDGGGGPYRQVYLKGTATDGDGEPSGGTEERKQESPMK